MRELNDQIVRIKSQMKEKERLDTLLARANDLAATLRSKRQNLYEQLEKENLDVARLEGMSVANIFQTILGRKEEQLLKEKREAISAKLKYDSACEEVANVEKEIADLKHKLTAFHNLEETYDQLLFEKEQLLLTASKDTRSIFDSLAEEKSAVMHQRKELTEAITAGSSLLSSLRKVRDNLKSAGNWGTLDMLGGGFLSTAIKHSKMDEARANISRTQSLLNTFHRELQDVGGRITVDDLEIGSFLTFADYFFDGLFADWSVQSRITKARDKVEATINVVEAMLANLRIHLEETAREEEQVERKRWEAIEKA